VESSGDHRHRDSLVVEVGDDRADRRARIDHNRAGPLVEQRHRIRLRVGGAGSGERLQLGGLIAGAPPDGISIELPRNRPEAWLIQGKAAPRPIPLLCDTLVVRADEQEIHLLWRGAIEAPADTTGHILIRPRMIPQPDQEDAA